MKEYIVSTRVANPSPINYLYESGLDRLYILVIDEVQEDLPFVSLK